MTARKALWVVEIQLLDLSPEGGTSLPVCVSHQTPRKADRLEAILYPTSHLIKGSVRFDDRFETAHPSPNRF
jgi:hypothetical protein